MVIAHQSDDIHYPVIPNGILKGVTGKCGSVTTQGVALRNGTPIPMPTHAITAQELMVVDAEPIQKAAENACRQDVLKNCQRIGKARWRCRPLRVVPMMCRNRACRTQHWRCLLGIMLRTAELVRHNQQLQRRISELQRDTEVFLKSVPVASPETTTSDSESDSRSSSPVHINFTPPNSVESD